jgi:ABC-type bacteriocin/lantibiotic exporter with double-glycine peptidase domain
MIKLIKILNKTLTKDIKFNLFYLFLILNLTFVLEFISLGGIPLIFAYILNLDNNYLKILLSGYYLGQDSENNLTLVLFLFLLIFFFKSILLFYLNIVELNIIKKLKVFISTNLFNSYVNKNYNFFITNNSNTLLRNVVNESENATSLINSSLTIFREIFLLVIIFFLLILFQPLISFFVLLILIIFSVIFYLFTDKLLKSSSFIRFHALARLYKIITQVFASIKEIKVFNKENFFINDFRSIKEIHDSRSLIRTLVVRSPKIFFEFLGVLIFVVLVFIYFKINKYADFIKLIPFLSLVAVSSLKLLPSFNAISSSLTYFQSHFDIFKKIFIEINSFKNERNEFENYTNKISDNVVVKLENISFCYDKEENNNFSLKNLNLQFRRNCITGLIGNSGSGKSTIVNIVLGLLKPQIGNVFINLPNKKKDINSSYISYVPQEIMLLDETLKKNIAFGVEEDFINENKVLEVIKKAGLSNFFLRAGNNLELSIGERGLKISGGEKQRIGIARALYFDPEILILDEFTSSLDKITEEEILDEVTKLGKKMSIIIISHKPSTMEICEEIFYINNGVVLDKYSLSDFKVKFFKLFS